MMGGAQAVLSRARLDYERGDYRWVAEVLNHLVFAQPDNRAARALLADTYDQLGYQAESGPWRDVYLTGALELRHGPGEEGVSLASAMDLLRETPVARFMDAMAVMFNGPKAEGKELVINIDFTDIGENYVMSVENSVLHHRMGEADPAANATIRLTHELFLKILMGEAGVRDTLFSDQMALEGSKLDLVSFFALLDAPEAMFNIVEP